MWILALLGCPKPVEPPAAPQPIVRVVSGPWDGAQALALYATGPTDSQGRLMGPAILQAAFIAEDTLWFTTSLNTGRGWKVPIGLSEGVSTGQRAQGRPEILNAMGDIRVLALVDGAPTLLDRHVESWTRQPLEPDAQAQAMDGLVWDGATVVAWVDPRGPSLKLWWDGQVETLRTDPALNTCARPALGVVDGLLQVAFWQGDSLHRLGLDLDMQWQELETLSSTSPGCDGALFVGESLVFSGGGGIQGEGGSALPLDPDFPTPGQLRPLDVLMLSSASEERVIVSGQSLLTVPTGELEIWDPAQVGGETWVPFTTSAGLSVAAYTPPETPL